MLARQFISIIFDRFSKAQNFLKIATVSTSSNEYGQFVRLNFNFNNISFSPLQYSFVFVKTVNTSTFYLLSQSYINVATNPTFTSVSSLDFQNNPKLQ
jgi:intein-encoded DNA endonuclease-like protein